MAAAATPRYNRALRPVDPASFPRYVEDEFNKLGAVSSTTDDRLSALEASSGGSGGGSTATAAFYSNVSTDSLATGTAPTAAAEVWGLDIPASSDARVFLVQGFVAWNSSPVGMRWHVYLDGSLLLPVAGNGLNSSDNSLGDGVSYLGLPGVVVSIPGDGAAHRVSIYWAAQDTTASRTLLHRELSALQVA